MRYAIAALMCLWTPAVAVAQQTGTPVSPPPSIGLPLPSIGLPLPPIGLDRSADRVPPQTDPPPPDSPRHPRTRPAIVIFGAPYAFGLDLSQATPMPGMAPASSRTPGPPTPAPLPETGTLRVDVEPAQLAQLFVDGEFVGTPADVGSELELQPGRRQIEIRADGYEPLVFDVRITAGRTITYEGRLQRVSGPAPPPANPTTTPTKPDRATPPTPAPRPTKGDTFYLIPGCYLGNVPPEQVKLPPGCDFSRMIIHKP